MYFVRRQFTLDCRPMLPSTTKSFRPGRAVFVGLGLLAIVAAFALDEAVDSRIFLPAHDVVWSFARAVSKYGDWPPVLLAGLVAVAVVTACRRYSEGRLLLLIVVAGLLTGLASTAIRATTGRTRPLAQAPQGFYGLRYQSRWIVGKSEFNSFPSGHTAVWAGLAGAAWVRRRRLACAFLVGMAVVAWSRIALGAHHFSDVTASLVWGMAVGPWLRDRLEPGIYRLWGRAGLPG